MTTAAPGPVSAAIVPRRNPRFPASVPIDFTVLRSGIPDSVPGRALNLCEGGFAAIVAAELRRGDAVAVQFRLPELAVPLRAKAVVRHQGRLRYGMEFQALSPESRAMIRYWTRAVMDANREKILPKTSEGTPAALPQKSQWLAKLRHSFWMMVAVCALITAAAWWHWYRSWSELESQLPAQAVETDSALPRVPAETMQMLVTHKVEPIYPEAAREANLQGLVLVKAIVGADGHVVDVHPVSGPGVLTEAAVDAVRWWRFRPYRVNGQAEEVETTVALEFHP